MVNNGPAYQGAPPNNGYNTAPPPPAYAEGDRRPHPIFAGADFDVRLEQPVSPATAQQGDTVPARLARDLVQNGRVVAPQGTAVLLRVTSAQGTPLDLRLDSMSLGPVTYTLRTTAVHSLRDSVGGEPAGENRGLGGFLNNIEGGPQIPRGTEFHFQLTTQAEPAFAGR